MSRLQWDQVGQRTYEAGVDRGVLYLDDGTGVVWNGLTGIEEDSGGDGLTPAYFDGIKYLDVPSIGDFAAKLKAITYPDEFLEYEGISSLGNGLYVDGQNAKLFGLSFRTLVGNDVDGINHGYKIHLIYNLTATPDSSSYQTLSDSVNPLEFSWSLSGVPSSVTNYRPTAHVIFDSTLLKADMFTGLEDILYGDADENARLPTINELVDFISLWGPKLISPRPITGLSLLVNGSGDLTETNVDGVYSALPTTRLVESSVDGFYQVVI